ncbi:MAG: hypothetical protein ABSB22_25385 [Thermodesulfobacteriota bacterium]|jgi:hypothetical protein
MNEHQLALLKWITAGLTIPEVRQLYGNADYLLNNMIAKYSLASDSYAISVGALAELSKRGYDITQTYMRSHFYGKDQPFIYEHTIPAVVVREALLKTDCALESVHQILEAGQVAMILRDEDNLLRKNGLSQKMPKGWKWGNDPLDRYHNAGIQLSGEFLKVRGGIVR